MRVQVSDKYKGVFGAVDEKLNIVRAKKAGDPPFVVPDDIAARKIKEGVLVRAKEPDNAPAIALDLPEAEEAAPFDAPVIEAETAVKEEPVKKATQRRRKSARK